MKFYQLGFRYLQRKKGKTILLLIVLILVNSMILGTSMILRTTNESKQAMQEKTNSKIVAEITSKMYPFIYLFSAVCINDPTAAFFILVVCFL